MKRIRNVLIFGVCFYLLITGMLYFLQEKLIFLPTQLPQEYKYQFNQPFEEIFFDSNDGARLNALHFKTQKPKGVILYFHGNAGDLSRWGEITSYFLQFEYDVLIMDYRTYGKSTGKLSETALYADAQLFYDLALERFPDKDIIVYGRSLGTTFATYVAAENTAQKLILETPFYSLSEVAQQRYPFLPVNRLLKYKFPTVEFARKMACPVTIIHGTTDGVIPYSSGEKLFRVLSNKNVEMVTVVGGEHNNLIEFEEYHTTITSILK